MIQGKVAVARPATVAALVAAAAASNGEKPKTLKGTLWLDTIVKKISISFPVTKLAAGGRATLGRIIPVDERQHARGHVATASFAPRKPATGVPADGCYIPTNCAPNTSTIATVSTSCTRPAVALVPSFAYRLVRVLLLQQLCNICFYWLQLCGSCGLIGCKMLRSFPDYFSFLLTQLDYLRLFPTSTFQYNLCRRHTRLLY